MNTRYIVIACCLALGACSSETAPPPASDAPGGAATHTAPQKPVETIASVTSEKFSIEPAMLTQCDPASEVSISWNLTDMPTTSKFELYVNNDGSNESDKLFSASTGNVGSAKTGQWAKPGTRFLLKDEGTKEVVAEALVGGPRC